MSRLMRGSFSASTTGSPLRRRGFGADGLSNSRWCSDGDAAAPPSSACARGVGAIACSRRWANHRERRFTELQAGDTPNGRRARRQGGPSSRRGQTGRNQPWPPAPTRWSAAGHLADDRQIGDVSCLVRRASSRQRRSAPACVRALRRAGRSGRVSPPSRTPAAARSRGALPTARGGCRRSFAGCGR